MKVTKAVMVNHDFQPNDWWKDYGMEAIVFDRSDDGGERTFDANVVRTENRGNVDYDKLNFLIDHYDDMPDVFFWGKSNIFKYVAEPDLRKAIEAGVFAPLLKFDHKTYSNHLYEVCKYEGGMYLEINDSWYVAELASRFPSYDAFAQHLHLPSPRYLPFPPGGNFILTKERVHRYGRDFYQRMADTLPHDRLPAEAHMCERTYYSLWQ